MAKGTSVALELKYDIKYPPASVNPWIPQRDVILNSWEMSSESHGRGPYTRGDSGGPFYLKKDTIKITPATHVGNYHQGQFYVGIPASWYQPIMPAEPSGITLNSRGTTAIARTEPTNPNFDAATFIGELRRDGLPSVSGSSVLREKTKVARAMGGEYLNVEFGWKPLISDLKKFADSVRRSHDIVENYRKGSDRRIRRRYLYPPVESTYSDTRAGFLPVPTEVYDTGTGTVCVLTKERTWFSGAFRYHLPVDEGTISKLRLYKSYADKLFGARFSPEAVWNVSPWTWAADWFGSTGDVLHNISALGHDGLVLQYGYVMHSIVRHESRVASFPSGTSTYERIQKTLIRKPATPYGFGVDLNALSAKQIAIIAALGLSRQKRV